mmetsp:Transcript_1976/g.5911  ORF Transcript_1976/g.5911 Transcript_1976/m.5911 type:complete len:176 (-) Transcript_1976:432-959(-)
MFLVRMLACLSRAVEVPLAEAAAAVAEAEEVHNRVLPEALLSACPVEVCPLSAVELAEDSPPDDPCRCRERLARLRSRAIWLDNRMRGRAPPLSVKLGLAIPKPPPLASQHRAEEIPHSLGTSLQLDRQGTAPLLGAARAGSRIPPMTTVAHNRPAPQQLARRPLKMHHPRGRRR